MIGLSYLLKARLKRFVWTEKVIKGGRHRSTFSWKPFFGDGKMYRFYFDNSAIYNFNGPHQFAVNKLLGFTDGTINHHKNSFRIGWRYVPESNNIEISAYTYVDGVRNNEVLTTIEIFEQMSCEVTCLEGVYRIVINEFKVHYVKRSTNIKWKYKHSLYPYFGGEMVAPQYIFINTQCTRLTKKG
jgi:hypothetical protein